MANLQRWSTKYWNQITISAGILTAWGLIFQHIAGSLFWANLFYGIATVIAGTPILLKAIAALQVRVMSIELLVSIAVIGAVVILEFEESAMVTFLFILGNFLEQKTLQKTHRAIQDLTKMQPTQATVLQGTQIKVIDIDDVVEGDILVVKVGDQIPVDGIITVGDAEINEALITGESKLVRKQVDDQVFMGSMVEDGQILIEAQKVGEDTTFGKIIELVEEAQDHQAPLSRFIDRFAKYYTPFVLVLTILILMITQNLQLAITILVLACPGALVIGAPVSNVAGIGRGAKAGILIKGGNVIDQLTKIDTILFDKTGTVTEGQPSVKTFKQFSDDQKWFQTAAILEKQTNHPLAQAVVKYYEQSTGQMVENMQYQLETIKGIGIKTEIENQLIWIGSRRILDKQNIQLTSQQQVELQSIEDAGQTLVIMVVSQKLVLAFGLVDQVRAGVKANLAQLRKFGINNLGMVTGDNARIASDVAKEIEVTQIKAQMLPTDKVNFLKQLQDQGHHVLFIGDGINDSPSIAQADVGIAMGSGTDVAIETSDVVLIDSNFDNVHNAFKIAKATMNNTAENVTIAIGVVAMLLIGVAYGWINMASGMLFHEVSILVVIFNAMRLLRLKLKSN